MALGWVMLASAVYKGVKGIQANKETKRITAENTAAIREQWTEEIRRTRYGQEQQLGMTRAMAGASGFSMDSDVIDLYQQEMQNVFQEELDWMNKAMQRGVAVNEAQGRVAQMQGQANVVGNFADAFAAGYGLYSGGTSTTASKTLKPYTPPKNNSYLSPYIYVPRGLQQ